MFILVNRIDFYTNHIRAFITASQRIAYSLIGSVIAHGMAM